MSKETLPVTEKIRSGSVETILSALFRDILHVHEIITDESFEKLLTHYIKRVYKNCSINKQSSQKTNTRNELLAKNMSFKTFIKGIRVLGIKKFEVSVKLFHDNGKVTSHTLPVTDCISEEEGELNE